MQADEELHVEKQRREWLSVEREKLSLALDDAKNRIESEVLAKEMEMRKSL